nr:hypothetical protein BaRGS_025122 [Batillaria attramentaria]
MMTTTTMMMMMMATTTTTMTMSDDAQEKQAADSLITILEGTVTKLKDAEADSARRSADSQGLEVTVDSGAGADLSANDLVAYLQDVADTVNGEE